MAGISGMHIMAGISWQAYHGRHIRHAYHGRHIMAGISWQAYHGKHIMAGISGMHIMAGISGMHNQSRPTRSTAYTRSVQVFQQFGTVSESFPSVLIMLVIQKLHITCQKHIF
jgi:hypothetical protein